MENTYVISDVHGRYDLLKEMVDECMNLNKDTIILLGDYIDGDAKSNSYLTLQYIYQLTKKYLSFCFTVFMCFKNIRNT